MAKSGDWGDDSVSKVLGLQKRGLEFGFPGPMQKPVTMSAGKHWVVGAETSQSS